jgi:hypothetical protein
LLSGTSLPALARLACTPKEKTMQLRFSRLGLGLALTIFTLAAQAGADTLAPLPEGYSGHGGMSAYRITPEIYAYHYDHGFSGGDAMGWDPQLQFVWSRVAAAKACGVDAVPESAIVAKLVARYGQSDTVHEMVGIGFHQAQIEAAKAQFCTATRLDQVWALLPQFVQGQFETSAAAPSQAEATAPTERVPAAAALAASAAAPPDAAPAPADATLAASAWTSRIDLRSYVGASEDGTTNGDEVLRVVRREHTGRAIGLQVAVGLLTRSAGGFTFEKEHLRGEKVKDIANPGVDLQPDRLRERMQAYFTAHPSALPAQQTRLDLASGDWLLVYQSLSDNQSAYELRYYLMIATPPKKISFFKSTPGTVVVTCQPQPQVASLEEWEADHYAMVRKTAQAYVDQCAQQFAERLPAVFPEPAIAGL